MTRKYQHLRSFGTVTSGAANIVWAPDPRTSTGLGRAVTAANEEVLCWDIKKGELLSRWNDERCTSQVTAIAQSRVDPDVYAVGYEDGSIRLWDSKIATVIISFNGHRSAITVLSFDQSGVRLASGSKDTDVIIWDLVAEVGLFRLRGHKDQITGLEFVRTAQTDSSGEVDVSATEVYLLTTSKDALIKLWDVASQYCIETHIAQSSGECWSLGLSPDGSGCITAGNDGELTVWSIDLMRLNLLAQQTEKTDQNFLLKRGTLNRQLGGRTHEIIFHPRLDYFALHGADKAIEIWRIRTEDEVKKMLARKRKRKREKEKQSKMDIDNEPEDAIEAETNISEASITDFFTSHLVIRTGGKIRSFDWILNKSTKTVKILTSSITNQIEVWDIPVKEKSKKSASTEIPDYTRSMSIDIPGHRADIRALSLSSDDGMLASASNGGLKIWNIRTASCIRTFDCGYALCCAFLPGDKIIVVGTKTGELELFDVASAALLDSIKAHEGAIWSLQVHPDGRSLVSGSADKSAKLWSFEVVQEEIPGTKRTLPKLQLVHTRTLKVADDILSVRFSPDARLLAVALLDNTVKVFFLDSLKLYLNLYGHKLPVLNMDISFDSKLIVTCSADKNIRLWGLDFGDCHKAFFAHHDSILQVCFVPHNQDGNGHHFFSCGKDKSVKYWDGDKFEQIQRLDAHHGEIWAMAVSRTGSFLVTASHDKSIRVWEQTDEQIFLEEEKEKQLEELYESTLTTSLEPDRHSDDATREVGSAGKQTVETLMAGERIAEALQLGLEDLDLVAEYERARVANPQTAPPARNLVFLALGNISAETHLLNVLQKIPSAALHDALLVLPFAELPGLLTFLAIFAERAMNIPLTCRILFFMLRLHHRQIVASRELKVLLDSVRAGLRAELHRQRSEMGWNLAALKVIAARCRDDAVKDYIDDEALAPQALEQTGRKRGFVHVA